VSPPLISVRSLGKSFGGRRVLHDVSFDVRPGEVVALVGESGSGKSTVARLIAGLMPASTGEIRLAGSLGMIFQDPFASLNPVHRVRYHLERPLRRHRKLRTVTELLEEVGLVPPGEIAMKFPDQLSGGQRQRVAIARALAVEPQVILADEPTSMLDASIRIGVLNLLRDLKEQRGIAFLYITHDLASARYLADRIMVMRGGEIVDAGTADELLGSPRHEYTRLLLGSAATGGVSASG
jgi:peptide/nickel transport system ATP-binding protein